MEFVIELVVHITHLMPLMVSVNYQKVVRVGIYIVVNVGHALQVHYGMVLENVEKKKYAQ